HIQGGKGRKDRDVMLSPKLLEALREHWRGLRRKPRVWLFPGNRWHTGDQPIHTNVVWQACQQAARWRGRVSPGLEWMERRTSPLEAMAPPNLLGRSCCAMPRQAAAEAGVRTAALSLR